MSSETAGESFSNGARAALTRRSDPNPAFRQAADRVRERGIPPPDGLSLKWRTLECWSVGIALVVQSGAVMVLAFTGWDGNLTSSGRSILQLMVLPVYAVTIALLARTPMQFMAAVRRNLFLALLLVLPFLSVLWSISPSITFRRAIGLALSILLAYHIAIRFTPRQFLVLTVLLLGGCMVLSLIFAVALPGWAFMPENQNLRGVFNHKNVLGWYAAVSTLASATLLSDRAFGFRPMAMFFFAVSVTCLLLSRSTTGLVTALSAACFAAFYVALARSRASERVVLILVGVQAAVVFIVSVDIFLGVLLEGTGKDASFTGRTPLWALVDEAIWRRLLLGYGYQAFWTEGNGEAWSIWTEVAWMAPHAHNGFRDSMLSFGIVGTLVLLIVIFRAIRSGALLHCRYPKEHWLWLNVMICVYLVMNLTESTLLNQNSLLFIIFTTAILMISLGDRRGKGAPPLSNAQ